MGLIFPIPYFFFLRRRRRCDDRVERLSPSIIPLVRRRMPVAEAMKAAFRSPLRPLLDVVSVEGLS